MDHTDELATPEEVCRAVLLALRERAQLGDPLIKGAIRVIEHLLQEKGQDTHAQV